MTVAKGEVVPDDPQREIEDAGATGTASDERAGPPSPVTDESVSGDGATAQAVPETVPPELRRLVDDCRAGRYAIVVVEDVARVTSDDRFDVSKLADILARDGVQLHCAASGGAYPASTSPAACDRPPRRDRRRIAPHRLPFGYRRGETPGSVQIDGRAAAVVRQIFDLAERGRSAEDIACIMQARGVAAPSGSTAWSSCSVTRILTSPLLTGRVVYGRARWIRARGSRARRSLGRYMMRMVSTLRIISDTQYARVAELLRRARASRRETDRA